VGECGRSTWRLVDGPHPPPAPPSPSRLGEGGEFREQCSASGSSQVCGGFTGRRYATAHPPLRFLGHRRYVLLAASDCLPIEEPVAIPDFQSIMLPLLQLAGSGETYSISQAVEDLADRFELTEEERTELLPSGQQPLFYNRVGWARTHLKKAGLLKDPRRGYFEITSQGREVLDRDLSEINMKFHRKTRCPEVCGGSPRTTSNEGCIHHDITLHRCSERLC
jgi:hypothetical protein